MSSTINALVAAAAAASLEGRETHLVVSVAGCSCAPPAVPSRKALGSGLATPSLPARGEALGHDDDLIRHAVLGARATRVEFAVGARPAPPQSLPPLPEVPEDEETPEPLKKEGPKAEEPGALLPDMPASSPVSAPEASAPVTDVVSQRGAGAGAALALAAPQGPPSLPPFACPDAAPLSRASLRAMMERSAGFRHPGVRDGVFRLDDLPALRGIFWDDKSPTTTGVPLVLSTAAVPDVGYAHSSSEVGARLAEAFPHLPPFDMLRALGLVAAGGAVAAALSFPLAHEVREECGDLDFFLVGHADDAARVLAIRSFVAAVQARAASISARLRVHVHRSHGAITLYVGGAVYQVVLRGYSALAEVLHGFDNGACAVAFDGLTCWLSELGLFAAASRLNVVSLVARRGSYEFRLAKYFYRGYGLVLPDLDAEAFAAAGFGGLKLIRFEKPRQLAPLLFAAPDLAVDVLPVAAASRGEYEESLAATASRCGFGLHDGVFFCGPAEAIFSPLCSGASRPFVFRAVDAATLLTPGADTLAARRAWYGSAFLEAPL